MAIVTGRGKAKEISAWQVFERLSVLDSGRLIECILLG